MNIARTASSATIGRYPASLRLACANLAAFFCGSANECDPNIYQVNCEGTQLAFCNAGKIERFDCVQLGFKGCLESGRARCEWELDF